MISVIVPVYNVSRYISSAISSILNQSWGDLDIIVVDDCGQDESMDFVFSFRDSRIRVLHHERNRGLSAARNTGISAAKGDWLFFVDGDDAITPDCLHTLLCMTESSQNADVVVGIFDEFEEENNYHSSLCRFKPGEYSGDVVGEYIKGNIPVTAWNKLIRKDFLLDNNLLFEEGLVHEDALWSFQVACKAKRIVVTDKVTYHYRQRQGSLDKQKNEVLHFTHYNRVYCLQSKYVFDHSLQGDTRIFQFIEKNRYQLLTDASMFDSQLGYDLYKTSRSYPYWMQLNRLMPVWLGYAMYIRLRCLWLKVR